MKRILPRLSLAMIATVIWFAATATASAAESQAEVEAQLLGKWAGGPCMGVLQFSKDGTFERRHYSPGNNQINGTWKLKWDALPPTLALTCKSSDDAQSFPVGKTWEMKLVKLDAESLAYRSGEEPSSSYRRQTLKEEAAEISQGLVIHATLKQAIGTFSSFGIPHVGDTFTLDVANLPKEKLQFSRPGEDRGSYVPFSGSLAFERVEQGKPNSSTSTTVIDLATPAPTKELRLRIQFSGAIEPGTKVRIVIYDADNFIGSMAEAEGVLK